MRSAAPDRRIEVDLAFPAAAAPNKPLKADAHSHENERDEGPRRSWLGATCTELDRGCLAMRSDCAEQADVPNSSGSE